MSSKEERCNDAIRANNSKIGNDEPIDGVNAIKKPKLTEIRKWATQELGMHQR